MSGLVSRHVRPLFFYGVLLTGCATTRPQPAAPEPALPPGVVVLLDSGQPSTVTVTTAGGRQMLDQPGQATAVGDSSAPPGVPFTSTPSQVNAAFGDALAAEPEPAVIFILYFAPAGSVILTEESEAKIPEILALIARRPRSDVGVSGHTDTTGGVEANRALSLRRAIVVRDRLVQAGVDRERLEVMEHGSNSALVETPTGVAEPRDRRAEVTVR